MGERRMKDGVKVGLLYPQLDYMGHLLDPLLYVVEAIDF
jgi:hypothetical protein